MLDADDVRQLGIAAEKPLVPLHGGADAEKELQLPFQLQFLQQVRTIQLLQLCGLLELLRKELGRDGQEHTVRHRLKVDREGSCQDAETQHGLSRPVEEAIRDIPE